MTTADDADTGRRAAQRLAELGTIEIHSGLTEVELTQVEHRFGFEFTAGHRAFLAAGLPLRTTTNSDPDDGAWSWPNWRDLDSESLHAQVNWPRTCILEYVANGNWPSGWGKHPYTQESSMAKAHRKLATVPPLIPLYSHRYVPAGRETPAAPILSIHHLTDMVIYGQDLNDYIRHEFQKPPTPPQFWRNYVES
ncbi:hypothetical protein [Paractinoplanes durhamensis]|uniref:SMI1/KNR4 family protein n=1 Tax=Paractinoplanes durhamensis TaxID=113563 RepID=A0ABQ3Z5Y5_9ACTN|nr:hypothetical protein [Actinoplanes durhamensis]GIE05240.1 hypothetical protein Adu01nite_65900 [Actinoplanes durhamensis]